MKKYIIKLSPEERIELRTIASKQRVDAQAKLRAKVFLASDTSDGGPAKIDQAIAVEVGLTIQTIEKLRAWAAEVGPLAALQRRPSTRVFTRKLDGRGEAQLIVLAKQSPPVGRNHWTLQLLADKLVELQIVDRIDDNTVGRTLKKTSLSPI